MPVRPRTHAELVAAPAPTIASSTSAAPLPARPELEVPLGPLTQAPVAAALLRGAHEPWRAYVRRSLVAAAEQIAARDPAALAAKLDKMKEGPFALFRGTAFLFYGLMAADEPKRPVVRCNGDVHPLNFGAMPSAGGKVVFGLDDPDESGPAPFSFDLKRGAAGFALVGEELGKSAKKRDELVHAFVDAYTDEVEAIADGGDPSVPITAKRADGPVRKLLRDANDAARAEFLAELLTERGDRFRMTDDVVRPDTTTAAQVADAVRAYVDTLEPELRPERDFFQVKDVVRKVGKGVGSLGRDRWYVLVQGPTRRRTDDVVLEVKVAVGSVLAPHASLDHATVRTDGARIAAAYRAQQAAGDPLFGYTKVGTRSCTVRELSPAAGKVEVSDLSGSELRAYARTCGVVLARAHARSGAGVADQILRNLRRGEHGIRAFERECVDFAADASKAFGKAHDELLALIESGALSSDALVMTM